MSLRLNLFGGVEVISEFGNPVAIRTRKAAALLAYLALHRHRIGGRERLAALLWEESSEEQARASLRQALASLRRDLPYPDAITADRIQIGLAEGIVTTDVDEFETLLADLATPENLARAVGLYRGDLLDGLHSTSSAFEAWLAAERQRLKEAAVGAMVALLASSIGREASDRRIALALRILALDPLQEPVHRALMRLYLHQGRRSEAVRQYFRCRAALSREISVAPEWETERLYREIRGSGHGPLTSAVGGI